MRQKVVRKFTTSEKSVVLLASLKAGGVGLNLVCQARSYAMRFAMRPVCADTASDAHRSQGTMSISWIRGESRCGVRGSESLSATQLIRYIRDLGGTALSRIKRSIAFIALARRAKWV